MYQYFLFSFLLFFISCSGEKGKIIHPDAKFLAKIKSADFTASLNDESSSALSFKEDAGIIKIIGNTEDVDSEYFLPEVGDVSVGSELIFIAIPQLFEIRAFDYNGEFRFKFGRTGRGPGEFEMLRSIDFDEATAKLVAVDLNEIEIYDIETDTAFHNTSISTPTVSFMSDACILDGDLFVNGSLIADVDTVAEGANMYSRIQASHPIRKYNLNSGEVLFGFGERYKTVSGFGGFDAKLSETKLHCNETSNTVVGIVSDYSLISGYNPANGEKKWDAGIVDFIPLKQEETIAGDVYLQYVRESFYDRLEPITELDSKFILLQTQIRPPNPEGINLKKLVGVTDFTNYKRKTILMNTTTGEISMLSDELEKMIFQNDQINISSPTDLENHEAEQDIIITEKQFSF